VFPSISDRAWPTPDEWPATGVIGPLFKAARIALPPNVRDASAA